MLGLVHLPPRGPEEHERYRAEIATDLSRVGEVVDAVCACCFAATPASPRTQFRLCTVVAEAVANAMLYGNDGDPQRHVTIDIALRDQDIVISVSDEGNGFDHNVVPFPIDEESREATRGRGLFMIHRLSDRVAFNDRGNTIWMTLPRQ